MVKLVAPAPFVLALLLLQVDRTFRRPSRLLIAFAVAVVVVLPWHAAMAWIHGPLFLDTYVGFHLFRRAIDLVAGGGPSIYVTWFTEKEGSTTILMMLALAGAIPLAFRGNRAARAALALLAGAVLPLAASRTALPHYLVPLLPGLGLAAAACSDAVFKTARPRLRIVLGWAMGLALAAAFLGANIRDLANPDYGPGAKAVCETLRASGDVDRLAATLDLHDPALVWYCKRIGNINHETASTTGYPRPRFRHPGRQNPGLRGLIPGNLRPDALSRTQLSINR
jgi:4-amino-4-deoxy-L-arabinose transferase-like glycosyltransferase